MENLVYICMIIKIVCQDDMSCILFLFCILSEVLSVDIKYIDMKIHIIVPI